MPLGSQVIQKNPEDKRVLPKKPVALLPKTPERKERRGIKDSLLRRLESPAATPPAKKKKKANQSVNPNC